MQSRDVGRELRRHLHLAYVMGQVKGIIGMGNLGRRLAWEVDGKNAPVSLRRVMSVVQGPHIPFCIVENARDSSSEHCA